MISSGVSRKLSSKYPPAEPGDTYLLVQFEHRVDGGYTSESIDIALNLSPHIFRSEG